MNPIPVVIDKVLLALGLYSVPVLLLLPSSCETGKLLRMSNSGCDNLPLGRSRCSSPCTRGGLQCSATSRYLLGVLNNRKAILK